MVKCSRYERIPAEGVSVIEQSISIPPPLPFGNSPTSNSMPLTHFGSIVRRSA